jgi:DNA-nicking Smr family endonuclease
VAGGGDTESSEDAEDVHVVEITDSMDLHHFAPRDMLSVVEAYLEAAHEKGLVEVRIIHGRGKGVQRQRVQKLLATHPLVLRYETASQARGGLGATVAWLVQPATSPAREGEP